MQISYARLCTSTNPCVQVQTITPIYGTNERIHTYVIYDTCINNDNRIDIN